MMWKKTLLVLFVASVSLNTAESAENVATKATIKAEKAQAKMFSESEVEALKTQWLQAQQNQTDQLAKQREQFLIADSLLKTAIRQKQFSAESQRLVEALLAGLENYPLKPDLDWAVMKAKIESKQITSEDISVFSAKYPLSPYQKQLDQLAFAPLFEQQKLAELVEYSEKVSPVGEENQCRVLAAQYQLLAEKLQVNPEATQADQTTPINQNAFLMNDLLAQFEKLWLKTTALPSECGNLEAYWKDQGRATTEKIRLKAVNLVAKKAKSALTTLANNTTDTALKTWLTDVEQLMNDPKNLPNFIETVIAKSVPDNPIDEQSKAVVNVIFPLFIKTIAEDTPEPNFEPYQKWAEKLGLSESEQKVWKIAFLNRLFDNENVAFQAWRDEQISQLQADNLTERRLRLAILQQSDLAPWLNLLSSEGKAKQEWRYWLAKTEIDPQKRQADLATLAKERGFYPMLAAQQLGEVYQLPKEREIILDQSVVDRLQPQFIRMAELRALQRFEQARSVWVTLLKELSTDEKLMAVTYANQQNWHDLTVEGTIQAKAFDYLSLRLPNAYSDWFDLHLQDKPISKTFAMAIARQESAWNFQARSHANALGLMQMLPSTAQKTAHDNQLPYTNEQDLLQPFNNIMLGTTHLAELNRKYPNNRFLIAAAYNAGVSRVERWLARAGGKLALDEFVASIPFLETRGYVQNVVAYDYYQQRLQKAEKLVMFYPTEVERKY